MMATHELRYCLHPQAAHRKVAGEVFIVTGDRAFHRLQTVTAVDLFDSLAQSAAGMSADELTALLLQRYDVSETTARADVATFLQTLLARQLAVPAPLAQPAAADPATANVQAKVNS